MTTKQLKTFIQNWIDESSGYLKDEAETCYDEEVRKAKTTEEIISLMDNWDFSQDEANIVYEYATISALKTILSELKKLN